MEEADEHELQAVLPVTFAKVSPCVQKEQMVLCVLAANDPTGQPKHLENPEVLLEYVPAKQGKQDVLPLSEA